MTIRFVSVQKISFFNRSECHMEMLLPMVIIYAVVRIVEARFLHVANALG